MYRAQGPSIPTSSPNSFEYFLPDALGSVRQLVDETGILTLAQAYQPYGETLNTTGDATSNYAFAGEWRDASGLDYLLTPQSPLCELLDKSTSFRYHVRALSPQWYNQFKWIKL